MMHVRVNPATVQRLRREARLSVSELAALTIVDGKALSRSHLSNIEHGNRPATPAIILALADALKVSPYALLGPEDPKRAIREMIELLGLTEAELFPHDPAGAVA